MNFFRTIPQMLLSAIILCACNGNNLEDKDFSSQVLSSGPNSQSDPSYTSSSEIKEDIVTEEEEEGEENYSDVDEGRASFYYKSSASNSEVEDEDGSIEFPNIAELIEEERAKAMEEWKLIEQEVIDIFEISE